MWECLWNQEVVLISTIEPNQLEQTDGRNTDAEGATSYGSEGRGEHVTRKLRKGDPSYEVAENLVSFSYMESILENWKWTFFPSPASEETAAPAYPWIAACTLKQRN